MNKQSQKIEVPTLANAIVDYMDAMKANYLEHTKDRTSVRGNSLGHGDYVMFAKPGRKFIKLCHRIDWKHQTPGQVTSHCFIVKQAHRTSGGLDLKVGDILMCASYYQPALNAVRGNVLTKDYGKSSWTGAGYL